ncbi:hypothetical protein OHAE_3601 [Ochrobactrum soli]|uniref:Uncharacterized protein n=1 Tax=Ochrobactrum soli TaxID=2448455 RepID=A0A2P9HHU8_9HYPH|nr:hypothetical protein OHAE_3601 [[Ochrobactrum] soli]
MNGRFHSCSSAQTIGAKMRYVNQKILISIFVEISTGSGGKFALGEADMT